MSQQALTGGMMELGISRILHRKYARPDDLVCFVTLHTPKYDVGIKSLISIEGLRDFSTNVCDYILVTFVMGMGDYVKYVVPDMDNLELSINRAHNNKSTVRRYKLLIVNNRGGVVGTTYASSTAAELNDSQLVKVEGQCVMTLAEVLLNTYTSGIYKYSTVKDSIMSSIWRSVNSVKIYGETPTVNFDIVEPNNQKVFRQICVDSGVRALDVPSYIQNKDYGVYNTGIGTYLTEDAKASEYVCYVYPLHNIELFHKAKRKLMILSSPTIKYTFVEHTYIVDGDTVTIIGAGDVVGHDDGDNKLANGGSGFVMMSNDVVSGGDGLSVSSEIRADGSGVSGHILKQRRDGSHGIRYVGVTSNPYSEYSKLSNNMTSLYQITWRHCDANLLIPGMAVSYAYDSTEGVVKLYGQLQLVFHKYNHDDKTTTAILNVLLSRPIGLVGNKDISDLRS